MLLLRDHALVVGNELGRGGALGGLRPGPLHSLRDREERPRAGGIRVHDGELWRGGRWERGDRLVDDGFCCCCCCRRWGRKDEVACP